MTDIVFWLDQYAQKPGRCGAMSAHTIRLLEIYLRRFAEESGYQGEEGNELYRKFVLWLSGCTLAPSSKCTIANECASYFFHAQILDIEAKKLIQGRFFHAGSQYSQYDFGEDDAAQLISACLQQDGSDFTRYRNAAMWCVLGVTGIRRGQIISLRQQQALRTEDAWCLTVPRLKSTSRDVDVKFVPHSRHFGENSVQEIMDKYMAIRAQVVTSDILFPNRDGRKLSENYLWREGKRLGAYLGLTHTNPHAFRHMAITRIAAEHGEMAAMVAASHSTVDSTRKYINRNSPLINSINIYK